MTGLYYYRARYYDPKIGRFISEDPIGFLGGTNFYAYVGGNPAAFKDPSGLYTDQQYRAMGLTEDEIAIQKALNLTDAITPADDLMLAAASILGAGVRFGTRAAAREAVEQVCLIPVSVRNLQHITKHLDEFRRLNPNMTLKDVVALGHRIAGDPRNLVGKPGGRAVFEATVDIGGSKVTVRAVLNPIGGLRSVNIRQ